MVKEREMGRPAWSDKKQMWRLSVQRNGERKWFTSTIRGRAGYRAVEDAALEWVESLKHEADGTGTSEIKENPTVNEAYAAWLDETLEMTGKTSWRSHESIGRNYILPRIGELTVDQLTTEQQFQDIINYAYKHSVQGKGELSHTTLQNIRNTMSGFLKYCRKCGYTTLRLEFVTLPKKAAKPNKRVLQPDELKKLFTSDKTIVPYHFSEVGPDPLIHMYRFHVLTGLRPGELIGLRWNDISGSEAHIQRSINYHGEITPGKNANARRTISLPKRAVSELKKQRDMLDELGIESDYVFPDPRNGDPMNHKAYRRRLAIYCRHNGIEDTAPYELRHTWFSVNKGLPSELVKGMGGHSEAMDTFGVYGHEVDGERKRFAKMLDGVMDDLLDPED